MSSIGKSTAQASDASNARRLLVVGEAGDFAAALCDLLKRRGHEARHCHDLAQADKVCEDYSPQIALVDVEAGSDGDWLGWLNGCSPRPQVWVLDSTPSLEGAVSAMRQGAIDYLPRPDEPQELVATILGRLNDASARTPGDVAADPAGSDVHYRALFEHSAQAVLVLEDRHIVACNEVAMKLLGQTNKSELLGRQLGELAAFREPHGDDSQGALDQHIEQALEQSGHSFEWTCVKHNDERFSALLSMSNVSIGGRQMLEVLVRDITHRKQAERDLQDNKRLFMQATALSKLGSWVWDDVTGCCIYASEEYARIQGLTVEEVMTRYNTVEKDLELVHPQDRQRLLDAAERDSAEIYEVEYRLFRRIPGWRRHPQPYSTNCPSAGSPTPTGRCRTRFSGNLRG